MNKIQVQEFGGHAAKDQIRTSSWWKNHPDSVQKKFYSHALVKNDKGEGMGAY